MLRNEELQMQRATNESSIKKLDRSGFSSGDEVFGNGLESVSDVGVSVGEAQLAGPHGKNLLPFQHHRGAFAQHGFQRQLRHRQPRRPPHHLPQALTHLRQPHRVGGRAIDHPSVRRVLERLVDEIHQIVHMNPREPTELTPASISIVVIDCWLDCWKLTGY